MRVVVIGGTGHIGSYLVPRLVEAGHGVTVLTRGQREPYRRHAAWEHVQRVVVDRPAEELAGTFGRRMLDLIAGRRRKGVDRLPCSLIVRQSCGANGICRTDNDSGK